MKLLILTAITGMMIAHNSKAEITPLTTSLSVLGVNVAAENFYTTGERGQITCGNFKGTHQLNTVYFQPVTSGGSGRYEQTLVWNFSNAYEGYTEREQQFEAILTPRRSYAITLPRLRDEVPFVQQSVLLITKDLISNEVKTDQKIFLVSRGIILSAAKSPTVAAKDCFERYPSYESTFGLLSNGTTNLSDLSIKQGVQKIWQNSSGNNWGYYFSPLSLLGSVPIIGGLGNLFTFNHNYFSSVSQQTSETVEVVSGYSLSPGDYIQIYTQKTRYVTNYDATIVDTCGATNMLEGAYQLQWWGFAYHAVPVNPYNTVRPALDTIGAPPTNTCPKELSPGFDSTNTQFIRTN